MSEDVWPRWRKLSEEKPPKDTKVLVFFDGDVNLAYYWRLTPTIS